MDISQDNWNTGNKKTKKILLFLDTAEHASPFDILLAHDSGFDVVIPYANVTKENCSDLIYDAVFPRGPDGVNKTAFFIGGEYTRAKEIFEEAKSILKKPYEFSVIFDPRGASTTSAAVVVLIEKHLGSLKGKKATILAGTGPVGRIFAILLDSLGCEVSITSRVYGRALDVSQELSQVTRRRIRGLQASDGKGIIEACKLSDIVITTGKIGVQILDRKTLSEIGPRIVADVNAVEPFGIEGIKLYANGEEIKKGIKAIGPLASGELKTKIEKEMFRLSLESPKFFDHKDALEIGRRLA